MLIDPTASAANALLRITMINQGGTLALVGDPGDDVISLQQPAVAEPDVDTDADWMDVVYDSVTQQLDANNTGMAVPYRGLYRVAKPEGETVGVVYHG